jgi:hypothetical protein
VVDGTAGGDLSVDAVGKMTDEDWMVEYESELNADESVFAKDEARFANHKWRVWARGIKLRLTQGCQAVPFLRRW